MSGKTQKSKAQRPKTQSVKAGGGNAQKPAPRQSRTSAQKGAPRADGPALDDFICFALYSANHAMNRVYKPLLDELGVTYPQYIALSALWERDGQTVGEICEKLFLESSTVTPLLKRLETMGLLARRRDATDERQVRVSLTPEGRRLKSKARKIPGCIHAASGLGEKALLNLQTQIADLRENLVRAAAE
ncbi:MarR family winged helix-turn-helix transcriptional regulator [Denitrobaculum tricleocarpae]|uniref:MarR family transcriptional regulator n=1 Tax=Denitrobaculum tricleocarpae TaxID=2591009 RepID=A0A545TKZ3_9PROT|nr:MarR family transcriptional regulator [Denitrobaculum tricleocarpae]TQV77893.1 MarR family transcriptional regulator [Denitrobaculum tricleocarpae]